MIIKWFLTRDVNTRTKQEPDTRVVKYQVPETWFQIPGAGLGSGPGSEYPIQDQVTGTRFWVPVMIKIYN